MVIGIIGAMHHEVDLIVDHLEDYEQVQIGGSMFHIGEIEGKQIVVAGSGIGKVNVAICTSIMIQEFDVDLIINTGIAGGLTNISHKAVVLATTLTYADVNVTAFGYSYGQIPSMPKNFVIDAQTLVMIKKALNKSNIKFVEGSVYTSDTFVTSLDQVPNLDRTKKCICEMEGAALAQTCFRFNKPFISIRYVSDVVGEVSQITDYAKFEKETAISSCEICLNIIKGL